MTKEEKKALKNQKKQEKMIAKARKKAEKEAMKKGVSLEDIKVEPKTNDEEKVVTAEKAKEETKATEPVKEEKVVEEPKPRKKPTVKIYHVSKRKDDGMWQVKFGGGEKAIKLFKTQKEAIEYAKKLADNADSSIVIHKEDGKIRKQDYSKK